MYKRVTKKLILEGAKIIHTNGYWSEQTREFLEKFEYNAFERINNIYHTVYVSQNVTNSEYEKMFKERGLI